MTEKRFIQKQDFFIDRMNLSLSYACANEIDCKHIVDLLNSLAEENEQLKSALKELKEIGDYQAKRIEELNNENEQLKQQIEKLEKLLDLISKAWSFTKEESVKEILRHEIKGIDTVTYESANAWNEYCILSNFFKEKYGEHWDNE